jgi:hypothetical protein
MSFSPIRFFNPPLAITSKGSAEGVDIGGSISVIAMDKDRNFHTAENIFAELSWGSFSTNKEISDQIESITMKIEDTSSLFDDDELVKRLVNSLTLIQANEWILFGIGDFECNSFMDVMNFDVDLKNVERLMEEQQRLRNQANFPTLFDDTSIEKIYVESQFFGKVYKYFHYNNDENLYSIFNRLNRITGHATGIVCTSQGAANFYIINENIHPIKGTEKYRKDPETLEHAFTLMESDRIFPISWFRIDLGITALKTLEQWESIRETPILKKSIQDYMKYVKKTHKRQRTDLSEKISTTFEESKIVQSDETFYTNEQLREFDTIALETVLRSDDLGIFDKKLKKKQRRKKFHPDITKRK